LRRYVKGATQAEQFRSIIAADLGAILVGPDTYRSPRHLTSDNPRFLSEKASYDVASNVCRTLDTGAGADGRAVHRLGIVDAGRGFHSPTSQLNLRRFCY
jgi:hypothetical protein